MLQIFEYRCHRDTEAQSFLSSPILCVSVAIVDYVPTSALWSEMLRAIVEPMGSEVHGEGPFQVKEAAF